MVRLGVRQASTFRAAVLREVGQPLKVEDWKEAKLSKDQVWYNAALYDVCNPLVTYFILWKGQGER
jgi:hypothetical protein